VNLDLHRWPLLLGAILCIGLGVWLLTQRGTAEDGQFAAFALLLIGAILTGAFIKDQGHSHE
jgi:hypothetical protein